MAHPLAFLSHTDCGCDVTSRYAQANHRVDKIAVYVDHVSIRVTEQTTRRALWTDSLDRPSAKALAKHLQVISRDLAIARHKSLLDVFMCRRLGNLAASHTCLSGGETDGIFWVRAHARLMNRRRLMRTQLI
ncbi:unnamed protein product [Ectocarpus sp. 13 AM-2016]